jgi:hypothetical protein
VYWGRVLITPVVSRFGLTVIVRILILSNLITVLGFCAVRRRGSDSDPDRER